MRWRPEGPPTADGVEVEIVEDEHEDGVLEAMIAARTGTPHSLAEVYTLWGEARVEPGPVVPDDGLPAEPVGSSEPAGSSGPGEPGRRGPGRRAALRRLAPRTPQERRRLVRRGGALLAVLAVVGGSTLLETRREAERLAALADVPGVLRPLDGPPEPTWTVSGTVRGETADHLLVTDGDTLRAVDPATGGAVWTREQGEDEVCRPLEPGSTRSQGPARLRPGDARELLVCGGPFAAASGDGLHVSVVDARTGETLHSLPQTGRLIDLQPVDEGGLVVIVATADARLAATRWDTVTGARQWTWVSADPLPGLRSMQVERIDRRGDLYLVQAGSAAAVDLDSGEEVAPAVARALDEPAWFERTPLGGGDVAVWDVPEDGSSGSGHVEDADGELLYRLLGPVVRPPVTDGSEPGILLATSPAATLLRGLDRTSGEVLWTSIFDAGTPMVQVDGLLVVKEGDGSGLRGVGVRDGSVRWTTPGPDAVSAWPLTDGRSVLAMVRRDSGPATLIAYALEDGAELWRGALPAHTTMVVGSRGGDLVAVTLGGLVGLR